MVKKVVIVGAGPSGLLMAHYLLARREKYQIDIYERRQDPRTVSVSKSRTFPIALNARGINALSKIPGLEKSVSDLSVEMWGTIAHGQNGKQRIISRKKPLIALDRTELTKVFLDTLEQKYDRQRFNLYFQHSCTEVDLSSKKASFSLSKPTESRLTVDYDLIIGADGARSQVRRHFLDTELFEMEQKYIDNDYKSIHLPCGINEQLNFTPKRDFINTWRLDDGTVVLLLSQCDGKMNGVIHFPRNNNQVTQLKSDTEVLQFFQQNFPEVGRLMPKSEAAAFLARPVSRVLTIKCNRYHHDDRALLIGDAAHAVSPSLGQGCNSALEDTTIFNRILDECNDDLSLALEQFTARRLADARAVVELSNYTLPFAKSLFIEFILRQRIAIFMHRLFPQHFFPPLFDALYESSISYSQIWHHYKDWCLKVKQSKPEFFEIF